MNRKATGLWILFWAAGLISPLAFGDAPKERLLVSGVISDLDGNLVSGVMSVAFRFYYVEEGGAPIWEETREIEFNDGSYSADLGAYVPLDDEIFEIPELYLAIQIGDDIEMTPRMPLMSVPFAKHAEVANIARSVSEEAEFRRIVVEGVGEVINAHGDWVGPTSGLQGAKGSKGDIGATGPQGPVGPAGTTDAGGIMTGSLADARLSSNVSLLGPTIESSEFTDGTLVNADVSGSAAIAGSKISPNFGSQNITTTGDLSASGGFKTMIGPFQETNVTANTQKAWEMIEDLGSDEFPMPWAGSVMGVSVSCKPGNGVTAGTLTVEPTINGVETDLEVTLNSSQGSNKQGTSAQSKDTDTFAVGVTIGCKATTSLDYLPTTLECVCLVFVEM